MADEVQDVLDEIVTLQKCITTPSDEKPLAEPFDEEPESVNVFPCFVNVPRSLGEFKRQSGVRDGAILTVEMQLLFTQAGGKYSDRSRRKWVQAVLDHFDQHQGLNGRAHWSAIERVTFDDPIELSGGIYIGVRFELQVRMKASSVALAV